MSIVFFCQGCGSRFEVDPRLAGKQGRCKKCGGRMTVPAREEVAAKAREPARVAVAVGGGAGAGTGAASSWIGEVQASKVSLAPLTLDGMPALTKPSMFPEDDLADSRPYVLAQPERRSSGRAVSQVSGLKIFWRQRLGSVEKTFRWINQTAYLVSVPFLMILLLGILVRSHSMANFGAIVVVALNVARFVAGTANVVVIPFRDGVNFKRLRKPVRRVIEPAITIGLVGLAFAFFPWLSKGAQSGESISAGLRSGLGKFERKFEAVKEKASGKAKALGIAPNDKNAGP